jgi:hypothetical protein
MRTFILLALVLAVVRSEMVTLNFQAVQHHYGDPSKGCLSDELPGQIQGVSGYDVCMPRTNSSGVCSSDLPVNTTATPYPAAQDAQGNKYCVLMCSGIATGTCPSGAKCVSPSTAIPGINFQQSVGLCMYPLGSARLLFDN